MPEQLPNLPTHAARAAWRPSRRVLLQTGLLGALGLWGVSVVARGIPSAAAAEAGAPGAAPVADGSDVALAFFRPKDRPLAGAVVEALLDWALPPDPAARKEAVERSVLGADRYFASYTPAVQDEARQALDLLELAPVRWLGGLWSDWSVAEPAAVNRYLEGLRRGRLNLSRQVYRLLEGIATVGWYSQTAAWPGIGYPGPPDVPRPTGEAPL
ncbi:MAG TPA: hypothetical protein VKB51_09315 [bacterium]|nr:hypothetical protein [bacterium]